MADSSTPVAPRAAWDMLHHHFGPSIDLQTLHPGATFLRILGVNYVHLKTEDGGDLYLTQYGVPYVRHLLPENWYESSWFEQKRQRLAGTGTVYRVPTKPVPGHLVPSIDIAVKWSRVGQDVPLDTFTLYKNINAEFNTPFEEFALLEELRRGEYGPQNLRILTQKPLAIYVPSERLQLWQTGRSRDKILARIQRRPGVEVDILRSYILIYGWIDGVDAVEAYAASGMSPEEQEGHLAGLTYLVNLELKKKGFVVADHKPTHIILRRKNHRILERHSGRFAYAIVDYELLARTDEHENSVRQVRRSQYLLRQRDRFQSRPADEYPEHLQPCRVLGVDYVFGHSESTGGQLWVTGNDAELFAYFLPERWRFKQVRLSETGQTYYVQTKDRVHLVWKVSRVGERPPTTGEPHASRILAYGYNAPFEEFALAFELHRRGVKTVYPRAIYMTGGQGELMSPVQDPQRYEQLKGWTTPEGRPVLRWEHDYITIWGYWRGREDDEAINDDLLWTPIDITQARAKGIISDVLYGQILTRHEETLARAGYVDLNLKGDHILLSYIPEGPIKLERDGFPELRHCNFELVQPLEAAQRR